MKEENAVITDGQLLNSIEDQIKAASDKGQYLAFVTSGLTDDLPYNEAIETLADLLIQLVERNLKVVFFTFAQDSSRYSYSLVEMAESEKAKFKEIKDACNGDWHKDLHWDFVLSAKVLVANYSEFYCEAMAKRVRDMRTNISSKERKLKDQWVQESRTI